MMRFKRVNEMRNQPMRFHDRSFLHVCPWLNACWLKVEVDSLMDLEFGLG